jgi:hypothetical protein
MNCNGTILSRRITPRGNSYAARPRRSEEVKLETLVADLAGCAYELDARSEP